MYLLTSHLQASCRVKNCPSTIWFPCRCVCFQWLFLVPIKGGRWHIIPQLAVYTTIYIYTTYKPLMLCLCLWIFCYVSKKHFPGRRRSMNSKTKNMAFCSFLHATLNESWCICHKINVSLLTSTLLYERKKYGSCEICRMAEVYCGHEVF